MDAEHLTDVSPDKFTDVISVDFDASSIYVVETHQQFDQCCFSGSGWSDDCYLLPFLYIHREVMDNCLLRIVTEVYMLKADISF